jgi:hypothetical protein
MTFPCLAADDQTGPMLRGKRPSELRIYVVPRILAGWRPMTGEVRAGWELSLLPLAAALIPAAALPVRHLLLRHRYDTSLRLVSGRRPAPRRPGRTRRAPGASGHDEHTDPVRARHRRGPQPGHRLARAVPRELGALTARLAELQAHQDDLLGADEAPTRGSWPAPSSRSIRRSSRDRCRCAGLSCTPSSKRST